MTLQLPRNRFSAFGNKCAQVASERGVSLRIEPDEKVERPTLVTATGKIEGMRPCYAEINANNN